MVKDDGPMMPEIQLKIFDAITIIEAKMTEVGGLDFEVNFEFVFMGLLKEEMGHRLQAFQNLVTYHKLSQKYDPKTKPMATPFGINICLWRLIANGQLFIERYLHPWDQLEGFHEESKTCHSLLDEWLADAAKTKKWGTLSMRENNKEFPATCFSFSDHRDGSAIRTCIQLDIKSGKQTLQSTFQQNDHYLWVLFVELMDMV